MQSCVNQSLSAVPIYEPKTPFQLTDLSEEPLAFKVCDEENLTLDES